MSLARLPDGLPPGRLVPGSAPGLWMTDEPVIAPGGLWAYLQERQMSTGWCPVLLARPDATGRGHRPREIDAVDAEKTLHASWEAHRRAREPLPVAGAVRGFPPPAAGRPVAALDAAPAMSAALRAPAGIRPQPAPPRLLGRAGPPFTEWPGLAAASPPHPGPSPEAVARATVGQMLHYFTTRFVAHVALVRTRRSADVPALLGWTASTGVVALSAVLRSWESRFGVRVIGFEGSSVFLSVASPPLTAEHAAHVALEHLLTGADHLNDGSFAFADYAEALRGERMWSFWWD